MYYGEKKKLSKLNYNVNQTTRCESYINNTQLFLPKAVRLEIWFGFIRVVVKK